MIARTALLTALCVAVTWFGAAAAIAVWVVGCLAADTIERRPR